ncbi:sugar kinase [Paenibacillus sp. YN15]|uniref:sugar kinase n=1 Tax=Paenibacillus sp. YN15 TaxID=1742774 RepID=UPI000DCD58BC|nr:sugar kinase [Paenibacillus sp. YN15]RAV04145.1 sugar kinase [Paenibacillus sp. YN15]
MDVVSIGETMVLFTPEATGQMRYNRGFSARVAGAETNTLIGLAKLGHRTGWISRVGRDEFGAMVRFAVRGEGVDVSRVKEDADAPTGVFFKEKLHERNVRVYYYRQGSAASRMGPEDVDEEYLAGAQYLYLTGITPALGPTCREMVFYAAALARKHGVKVVFDPNLRRKLWSEQEARETLTALLSVSDLVLAGTGEGSFLFGTEDSGEMARRILDFGCQAAVIKLGEQGAYYRTASGEGIAAGFPVAHVVDPVGAGDGFAAGVLSGLLDGLALPEAVRRGCAIGAAVVTVNGDVEGLPDRQALAEFMNEGGEDVAR